MKYLYRHKPVVSIENCNQVKEGLCKIDCDTRVSELPEDAVTYHGDQEHELGCRGPRLLGRVCTADVYPKEIIQMNE